MPIGDVLPEISLTLGAVAIVLFASFVRQRQHHWAAVLALLAIGLGAGLTFAQWGGTPRLTFSGVWALDGVAPASKLVVLAAGALPHELRAAGYEASELPLATQTDADRA